MTCVGETGTSWSAGHVGPIVNKRNFLSFLGIPECRIKHVCYYDTFPEGLSSKAFMKL